MGKHRICPAAALIAALVPAGAGLANAAEFYAFRSYQPGRAGYVTLLASYPAPAQERPGAARFSLDPEALYEIHVDNDGDCSEDLTFQFRFRASFPAKTVEVGGRAVFVPFTSAGPDETYTVKLVRGDRRLGAAADIVRRGSGASVFSKPLEPVSYKAQGGLLPYADYADSLIHEVDIPGCPATGRVFVGRRQALSAGSGDAVPGALSSLSPAEGRGGGATAIAIEVPAPCLRAGSNPVIGAWTTTSLRQARLLDPRPSAERSAKQGGPWTQVARAGSPGVASLFVGLPDKSAFNASKPADDEKLLDYLAYPAAPALIGSQFGYKAPPAPREDLVAAFASGFAGINQTPGTCEMLRLNTGTPPTPLKSQNRLGALGCFDRGPAVNLGNPGCDPAGYPNGRRPGDDVFDIVLRLTMGALLPAAQAPDGTRSFNEALPVSESARSPMFPYRESPPRKTL